MGKTEICLQHHQHIYIILPRTERRAFVMGTAEHNLSIPLDYFLMSSSSFFIFYDFWWVGIQSQPFFQHAFPTYPVSVVWQFVYRY